MLDNIRLLTHSSIRIENNKGVVIYVDPYDIEGEACDADVILITHSHYDHFSPKDIAKIIKTNCGQVETKLFMPEDNEQNSLGFEVSNVEPGFSYEACGVCFETVPAYNIDKEFHPEENEWVGYIIDVDGQQVYIAGDTDANDDIMDIVCDVALVPVGGTYTMNPEEAADFINEIRPEYAIPTHYGSVVGDDGDADEFAANVDSQIEVLIKKEL